MNYHLYSRKKRKLKRLLKQLNVTDRKTMQFKKLILKINKISNDLKRTLSLPELRKVLGPAAIFLGLSLSNVNAQQFQAPVSNPFGTGIPTSAFNMPALTDLDGDGDFDMLTGLYGGVLVYQRNSGTASAPLFDPPQVNPFGLTSTYELAFPEFADLDNDGDMDLMVGEYYGAFQYYENIGSAAVPMFAAPIQNPFGLSSTYYINDPNFVDLDGDGDLDILSTEYYGQFQFFENIGSATAPQFGAPFTNPFGITLPPNSYYSFCDIGDFDNDGDFDILSSDYGIFNYYENTGTAAFPQFATPAINPFNLIPPSSGNFGFPESADLDNDGDLDIVLGTFDNYGAGVDYYENLAFPIGIDNDGDGFPNTTDCNDADATVYPGATEICDGKDNNCDGMVDEGFPSIKYYEDLDGDGYGNPNNFIGTCSTVPPAGYVALGTDCDDYDSTINPGAIEVCDGIDNNCDGDIDEGVSFTYYLDSDNDTFGDPAFPIVSCSVTPPGAYVSNSDDCDDSNPNINPNATDIPNNGIDEDCDGMDATTTANENQAREMGLKVFPNPTASQLTVTAQTDEEMTVSIFDQTGKLVVAEQHVSLKNGYSFAVDGFAVGVYLIKLQDSNGNTGTKRFTVIRE